MRISAPFIPFIAVGLALFLAGCGTPAELPAEAPLVRTITIGNATAESGQSFAGTVHSRIESDLGFRVDGKITERLVSAGQHVKRGQPLMRLDASDYYLAKAAATADLAAAEARASHATMEKQRRERLFKEGAVSRSEMERAEAESHAAAEAVKAARAQAGVAANRVAYSELTAEADGVVLEVNVEAGELVAAGQPALRLAHDGPRDVEVALPEQYGGLDVGAPALAVLSSEDTQVRATLRVVAGSADPATRTYRARFALDTEDHFVLGATARVVLVRNAQEAFEAPLSAIHDVGQGPGVWIVDQSESIVTWRAVELSTFSDDKVRILSGVQPGERIVTLGTHLLTERQAVRTEDEISQSIASNHP